MLFRPDGFGNQGTGKVDGRRCEVMQDRNEKEYNTYTEKFIVEGRAVTLHQAAGRDAPLVVLNHFEGDGSAELEVLKKSGVADINLLNIGNLQWNHDMSPWACPPLTPQDTPFTGGADAYLRLLQTEILPAAIERTLGKPPRICIVGYSLAGLFALYALYQCDLFDAAASISGSLWFPGFTDYVRHHAIRRAPDRIYLSLGDREAAARNKLLRTVQEHTESIAAHYRGLGIDVTWELNPGNHFRDAAERTAKGIRAIL